MLYIIISAVLFVIILLMHMLLHNILVFLGRKSFKTIYIFAFGFFINVLIVLYVREIQLWIHLPLEWWNPSLPWTSLLLFASLSSAFIVFFASPYLEQVSPSSRIISYIMKNKAVQEKAILNQFSDNELIGERLNDLVKVGWIKKSKENGTYKIMPGGELLARFILFYRKLLRMELIG